MKADEKHRSSGSPLAPSPNTGVSQTRSTGSSSPGLAVVEPEQGCSLRVDTGRLNPPSGLLLMNQGEIVEGELEKLHGETSMSGTGQKPEHRSTENPASDGHATGIDALIQAAAIADADEKVCAKPLARRKKRSAKRLKPDTTVRVRKKIKLALPPRSLIAAWAEQLIHLDSEQRTKFMVTLTERGFLEKNLSIPPTEPILRGSFWVCPLLECGTLICFSSASDTCKNRSFTSHLKKHRGDSGLAALLFQQELKKSSLPPVPAMVEETHSQSVVNKPETTALSSHRRKATSFSTPRAENTVYVSETTKAVELLKKHGMPAPTLIPRRVGTSSWECPLDDCKLSIRHNPDIDSWNRCSFSAHMIKHKNSRDAFKLLVEQELNKFLLATNISSAVEQPERLMTVPTPELLQKFDVPLSSLLPIRDGLEWKCPLLCGAIIPKDFESVWWNKTLFKLHLCEHQDANSLFQLMAEKQMQQFPSASNN